MANKRKSSNKEGAILNAAMRLLEKHGPDGLTTRSVCQAAKITAPTLYHHFGDKRGLLDAVVAKGFEEFLRVKSEAEDSDDPYKAILAGWDRLMEFVLEKPRLYDLLIQSLGENPEAIRMTMASTEKNVRRLSEMGALKVDVNFATNAILAVALGVTSKTTSKAEHGNLKALGRFLMKSTLDGLTLPTRPGRGRKPTRTSTVIQN